MVLMRNRHLKNFSSYEHICVVTSMAIRTANRINVLSFLFLQIIHNLFSLLARREQCVFVFFCRGRKTANAAQKLINYFFYSFCFNFFFSLRKGLNYNLNFINHRVPVLFFEERKICNGGQMPEKIKINL